MNRNNKVIKGIGVVALSGVVATSALTMTSCGKKTSKADSIVITLADGENNGEECLSSQWLPLSEITTNPTFREAFETLTHNRTTSTNQESSTSTSTNQKKEGTIYYLENPTLQTSLKNTAFTTLFDSLDTATLLSLTQDLYLDLDETTSPDILKAAVINTYFNLFNTKQNASANEFNASQRISRVDFITALVKSTTSPQSNESSLSENEIMSKLSDKSYLGVNNTNNTETGIITKAEAAYLVCNTLFNNEMSEAKADKPAENLQNCLENGNLSSDLKEALEILENKGIISNEFVANWNKALSKSEAVEMVYKSLKISGLNSEGVVNEDVIADEEVKKAAEEAARALEEARENAIEEVNSLSRIEKSYYIGRINELNSIEEINEVVENAKEQSEVNNNTSVTPKSKRTYEVVTPGTPESGTTTNGGGTTNSGATNGGGSGNGPRVVDHNTELIENPDGDGGITFK